MNARVQRTGWCGLLLCLLATTSLLAADKYARQREEMVRRYVAAEGVRNARVLSAMRATRRHEFLPNDLHDRAYFDMALPIGHGQTISPPYIVAFMTEQLNPQPDDRVLEIGTGSGYQAAVLSPLVKDVYSIEIVEPLGLRAAETLKRLDYQNVHTKVGDGYLGWPEHAPFNKIIVTCSPENIPKPLEEQLAEGGMLIIPVGERFQQTLYRFTKVNGKLQREALQSTFFVPMTGESESQRQVLPDNSKPQLAHGGFEEVLDETTADPDGWYYVREGHAVAANNAPEGKRVMEFENKVMGRSAHALQSFGVDGQRVRQLKLGFHVDGQRIRPGRQKDQAARVILEFYGEDRGPVGNVAIGSYQGSFTWRHEEAIVEVPPGARLAVIGIGLFGATGTIRFDDITLESATSP